MNSLADSIPDLKPEEADEGSWTATAIRVFGSLAVILLVTGVFFGSAYFRRRKSTRGVSILKSLPSDIHQGTIIRNNPTSDRLLSAPEDGTEVKTCFDLLASAASRFGSRHCLGSRTLIKELTEEREVTEGGKQQKKKWSLYQMSSYEWLSYAETHERAKNVARGLAQISKLEDAPKEKGMKRRPIAMYCETRAEWMLVLGGCVMQSVPLATVYVNLGEEALGSVIEEIEAEVICTSADLLPNLLRLLQKTKKTQLRHLVLIGDKASGDKIDALKKFNIEVTPLEELEKMGQSNSEVALVPPQPEDVAVIMYTSGTTGKPKGVIMTHANLVAAVAGLEYITRSLHLNEKDSYMAFLPLSHVLELVVELTLLHSGVALGYGRVRTLTDHNMKNSKGDLRELRPTLFVGVPSVYETMYNAAKKRIASLNLPMRLIVRSAIALKKQLMSSTSCTMPILDSLIFRRFAEQMGGRIRFMVTGGAALTPEVHQFMRAVLCAPLVQGYGLTESCGMCAAMPFESLQLNSVGAPVPCVELKLIDVAEMQYYAQGVPPRGEILIRGPAVASRGYFKMPEKTAEDFLQDGWFKTGDVGEWDDNGILAIIDRKKNLVKLSGGEYIAVERVEQVYKRSDLVKQIMVHADSSMKQPIAIVIPKEKNTSEDELLQSLQKEGQSGGLQQMEIVSRVVIAEEDDWSPENDMATAAMKIKRQNVIKKYKEQIENPDEQKAKKSSGGSSEKPKEKKEKAPEESKEKKEKSKEEPKEAQEKPAEDKPSEKTTEEPKEEEKKTDGDQKKKESDIVAKESSASATAQA